VVLGGCGEQKSASAPAADAGKAQAESDRLNWEAHSYCVTRMSFVPNHHQRDPAERLTAAQHEHHDLVVETTHVHLRPRAWRACAAAACLVLGLEAAAPQCAAAGAGTPLRVVTNPSAPFVLPQLAGSTARPAGFSVDLWEEIARRMGVAFTWNVVRTQADLLDAVADGRADVAIAAIGMSPERERRVDFSHPYYDSGLRIAVRARQESSLRAMLASIPWPALAHLFALASLVVILLANVFWLIERRSGGTMRGPYWRAIGHSMWATVLIIATGEYGDRDAPHVVRRIAVVAMWLIGVVLIAQLTATVTSTQTVQRLQATILGPDDLPGKSIGSVPGTLAEDYLRQRGLPFTAIPSGPDGIRMLVEGEVQAVVFDAPTLEYWAARQGNGAVDVVGPIFRPEKFGIAVAMGSPLRKQINEALLEIYEDGTYDGLSGKWFSQTR